ncbi:MAG: AroM family protein [Thermovirgaceae bacterium]|nr:AroM family protein [Candidatus Cloacimonadota bacterium]
MATKLGVLLIGQTPNKPYETFFRSCLPEEIDIEMVGALDGLGFEEVLSLKPKAGEEVLFTRVGENIPVNLSAHQVHSRMQNKLEELDSRGVSAIAVVCTGDFSFLHSETPLLFPGILLSNNVYSIASKQMPIGVMLPLVEQIGTNLSKKWYREGITASFAAASPQSHPGVIAKAATSLKEQGARLIVLDCMAYTSKEKDVIRSATGCMVIAARTLLGNILRELFQD